LFFDVARIINQKRPKAFLLENVKGLVSHDKGKTLSVILNTLRDDLGYYVPGLEIIDAKNFSVPQLRERIFIVGYRNDIKESEFIYPESLNNHMTFGDIKEENPVSSKYYLSEKYLETLRN